MIWALALLSSPITQVKAVDTSPLKTDTKPSISISTDHPGIFSISNLEPNGVARIDSANITITTDNPTGYMTTLSMNSTTDNCLRRPSDSTTPCNTPTLKALQPTTGTRDTAGVLTPSTLTANEWGASLSDTAFSTDPGTDAVWFAIPASGNVSLISSADVAASTGDDFLLTIGAKSDYNLPATTAGSEYTGSIVITASTKPIAPATVTSVTTNNAGNNIGANAGNYTTAGLSGGDTMTITGTNLDSTYEVTIDGVALAAEDCGIVSSSQVVCTTLAKGVGSYDVAVKTWGSLSGVTADQQITYVASPTPSITAPTANQIFATGTASTDLKATTNIYATCYYGDATNPTTQMSTTNTSGTGAHQQSISLANASTNTRYVRCKYPNSPESTTVSVTFYVRAATPAVPTLTPASGSTVVPGTTAIIVTSAGAICKWGTSSGNYPNASGDNYTTATDTTSTLYYSCIAGSDSTASEARIGSWNYIGAKTAQNIKNANCPLTATAIADTRDGHFYYAQKMADGNCWMLTNLAYGGDSSGNYIDNMGNFKSGLTHHDTGSGYSTGWTTSATSTAYYIDPFNDSSRYGGGVVQFSGTSPYCPKSYSTIATLSGTECGYLYNWYAATAGTGTAAMFNNGDNATASICPVGWKLPTGGNNGELAYLNAYMAGVTPPLGHTTNSAYVNNWLPTGAWRGVYSGIYNPGTGLYDQGTIGYYWSATVVSNDGVYDLYLHSSTVYPGTDASHKYYGFAVRCLAAS